MNKIASFQGENRFLSNFWLTNIEFEGIIYPSVEHAYQAAKTLDITARLTIRAAKTPGDAKRLSKVLKVREDWGQVKLDIMEKLCFQKFILNTQLRDKLAATGDAELIEGNAWGDTFWGVCKGEGRNELGKILMKIRDLNNSSLAQ